MYEIRKAKISDLETISTFQVKMAFETEMLQLDTDVVRQGVTHLFNHPEKGYYLVANTDQRIVASSLILYEWSDWRNSTVLWIHSVYVVPAFRKQGIFTAIYSFVKKNVLADSGYAGIRLYVDKRNSAACEVYRRLGMDDEHYRLFEWLK
ncbi:MAG: GNAT family N-acetyltransferase [Bacteroidales bacterium]|nr:GNAT family N-acetyltransferase [Bacteroidales bacterium]